MIPVPMGQLYTTQLKQQFAYILEKTYLNSNFVIIP